MGKWRWAVCSAVVVAGLTGASSAWAGTLDQQQTSFPGDGGLFSDESPAQTFTAGITGGLDQVDLVLATFGTPPASVTVEIRNAPAGAPGTTVLATASLPTSAIGTTKEFIPVTFATPAPVVAGTQYAIVAYSPGTGGNAVGWGLEGLSNLYPAGATFLSAEFPPGGTWEAGGAETDFAFKTYVIPAPPTPPDVDPPETTITKDVKRSETGKAKFRFSSDEAATFECKLKGPDVRRKLRQFNDCGSPRKYKNLDEGGFRFEVRSIDAAGNVDLTPAKDRFRVVD